MMHVTFEAILKKLEKVKDNYNLSKFANKKNISSIIVILIIAVFLVFGSPNFFKKTSSLYVKLSNPVTSYLLGAPVEKYGLMPTQTGGEAGPYIAGSQKFYLLKTSDEDKVHQNLFIKILSFGQGSILAAMNTAIIQGQYILPYSVYIYGKDANYEARYLNAPAMLLYGYSWIINIPSKFLGIIDTQLQVGYNRYTQESAFGFFIIDDIISLVLTLCIDLPLSLINTVIGTITAFIFHPIDSILAIPSLLYFFIVTTFHALWGILSNIILIVIHIF